MNVVVRRIAIAGLIGFLSTAAHADFQDRAPITLTTSGATASGFGRAIVEALNAIVRDAYPGSTMTFRPNTSAGGLVDLINNEAHITIGASAIELGLAVKGEAPFEKPMKDKLSFVFNAIPGTEFFFVATKAWADGAGVRTFDDFLKKKPKTSVSFGNRGSIYIGAIADALLKTGGTSVDDIEKHKQWPGSRVSWFTSNKGLDEIKDGKLDFQVGTAFQPFESINEVARVRDLVWITVPDSTLKAVQDQLGGLEIVSYPKGFYPFITEEVRTIRINLVMVSSVTTSEEAVYKYLKAIGENMDRFRAVHPSYRNMTLAEMAKKPSMIPYHPGAERYFREVGVLK